MGSLPPPPRGPGGHPCPQLNGLMTRCHPADLGALLHPADRGFIIGLRAGVLYNPCNPVDLGGNPLTRGGASTRQTESPLQHAGDATTPSRHTCRLSGPVPDYHLSMPHKRAMARTSCHAPSRKAHVTDTFFFPHKLSHYLRPAFRSNRLAPFVCNPTCSPQDKHLRCGGLHNAQVRFRRQGTRPT